MLPAEHVSLLDKLVDRSMVVSLAATKEQARIEALHRDLTAVPLAQIHLQRQSSDMRSMAQPDCNWRCERPRYASTARNV